MSTPPLSSTVEDRSPVESTGAPILLKEMTPSDVAAQIQRDQRLILPVGTCDQHGPHLPIGTATMIAERISDDLSARYRVLRAPAIEYGVNIGTEREFAGNGSVRKKTLHRVLNDLIACWESSGIREFILLTAHDHDPHQEALETVITTESRVRAVDIFAVDISDLLDGQPEHMHGGEADTALMLHIAPHLVNMSLAQDYMMSRDSLRRYRRGWLRVPRGSPGSIGRPSLATAEKGRAIYLRLLDRIAERIFLTPAPEE
jgi:creatinine amidohydrolase